MRFRSHVRPGDPVRFTHQAVGSVLNLSVEVPTLLLSVKDGSVDQPSVSGLSGSSEDKRWVSGSVLQ